MLFMMLLPLAGARQCVAVGGAAVGRLVRWRVARPARPHVPACLHAVFSADPVPLRGGQPADQGRAQVEPVQEGAGGGAGRTAAQRQLRDYLAPGGGDRGGGRQPRERRCRQQRAAGRQGLAGRLAGRRQGQRRWQQRGGGRLAGRRGEVAALGGRLVCQGGVPRRSGCQPHEPGLRGARWRQVCRPLSAACGSRGSFVCQPAPHLCTPFFPLRQVITVNIYRNMRESFQTFDYISQEGNFGWVSREAGERRQRPAQRQRSVGRPC